MNRKIMKMASVALVLILAVGMAGAAAAAAVSDVNFTVNGGDKLFVFTPASTDLFQNFKNLMPGDVVTQDIIVQNTSGYITRIWLRADPVGADDVEFLSQLKLTVTADDSQIFEAVASARDGLAPTEKSPYGVLLGTFKNKGTVQLLAKLEVPMELGNEFQNEQGVVPWTFTAEEVVLPDTPDTGDDFAVWVWVGVAAVLMAGIVVLVTRQRKQRAEN